MLDQVVAEQRDNSQKDTESTATQTRGATAACKKEEKPNHQRVKSNTCLGHDFKSVKQEVEWSTRAPDVHRISARVLGTRHKVKEKQGEEEKSTWVRQRKKRHLVSRCMRSCQTTKLTHRVAHSQPLCIKDDPQRSVEFFFHQASHKMAWTVKSDGGQVAKHGFVHDVPASGEATILGGDHREARATTTQCQSQRNGNKPVALNEMLPPWTCHGLRVAGTKQQWCR